MQSANFFGTRACAAFKLKLNVNWRLRVCLFDRWRRTTCTACTAWLFDWFLFLPSQNALFPKQLHSFSLPDDFVTTKSRACDSRWWWAFQGGVFNWLYCRRSGLNFALFIPFFRLASNYRFRRLAACNEAINGQLPGWPSYYVQIDSGLRVWASSICLSVYLIPFTGPLVVRPFTSALSIARELTTKYDQLIPHNYKQKIQFNFGNHAIAVSVVQTILTQNCKYGFNSYLCL